ncbi:DUF4262 domain-containing protein [Mycolicibacterium pallens]|nr:DUF4262 domain-containing protein [Mycolicibacterium pallens]
MASRNLSEPARIVVATTTERRAMCWRCDHPDATTEDYLEELQATIRDHGWAVQFVESENRPFAYTIGLHDHDLPELLITGLRPEVSASVLNSIAHMIVDDGTTLEPAMHIDFEDRFLIEVVEVEHPDVHLKFGVRLFGPRIRAFQLVWADNHGRFPWEPGWGHGRRRQPVLGVRTELSSP